MSTAVPGFCDRFVLVLVLVERYPAAESHWSSRINNVFLDEAANEAKGTICLITIQTQRSDHDFLLVELEALEV